MHYLTFVLSPTEGLVSTSDFWWTLSTNIRRPSYWFRVLGNKSRDVAKSHRLASLAIGATPTLSYPSPPIPFFSIFPSPHLLLFLHNPQPPFLLPFRTLADLPSTAIFSDLPWFPPYFLSSLLFSLISSLSSRINDSTNSSNDNINIINYIRIRRR